MLTNDDVLHFIIERKLAKKQSRQSIGELREKFGMRADGNSS